MCNIYISGYDVDVYGYNIIGILYKMAGTNQQQSTLMYSPPHPYDTQDIKPDLYSRSQLFVRPISWSSVNPSAAAIKLNPALVPSIQVFGYTPDGRMAYVRVPRKSTFIMKFAEDIDEEVIVNIIDILNPDTIKVSDLDPKIIIVRAPELSPIELTANPDYEGIATWTDITQDPYGELESFWEAKEIGPYEWISISKFTPLPGKYTSSDLNIISDEAHITSSSVEQIRSIYSELSDDFSEIFPRLLFWDIETFASKGREFPNSSNPEDFIFMISIMTVSREGSNGYVIVKGDVNPDLINQAHSHPGSMVLVKAKDEKDLITQFFAIYNTFKPDRQIYYNGDMFDMPYLLDRLNLHNYEVPKISKVLSLIPRTASHYYPTPFGREMARTILLPGTEIIDLIHYYRRFYPHLKNHRLDTIAKFFLKEGKTGLTIEEMMEAIRVNDADKIAKVVDYSFVDSLRMYQLWDSTNIQSRLETVCNNLGISIDTLLHESFERIVNLAVYNIDAGSALVGGTKGKPNHLNEAVKGIYRDVYIYDYSELYREIMLNSDQPIASVLAERLEGAPPQLILAAFYSEFVDRSDLLPLFTSMLDSVIGTKTVIALEPTIIRSIGPLNSEWLNLIERAPSYVAVGKASYLVIGNDGTLETAGLSKLCRPKFELAADVIYQYLSRVYANELDQFMIPDLKLLPIEKMILTEKIGDITNINPDGIKYKLAVQYGAPVTTWVSVKYIMTPRGPVLISKLRPDDTIDNNYYEGELGKYIKDLQALKVYGV